MSKKYSREELISRCETALNKVEEFYNQNFVNWTGTVKDCKDVFYTDVIAEFVLENIGTFFDKIKTNTRNSSYKCDNHNGAFNPDSNRIEEITAIRLFLQSQKGKTFKGFGKVIDYQTPLRNKEGDSQKAIDLLSINNDTLYILELKKIDSPETLLRCILESFTYSKVVDDKKLIADFNLSPIIKKVVPAPLIFKAKDSQPWLDYKRKNPSIMQLISKMGEEVFFIEEVSSPQYDSVEV